MGLVLWIDKNTFATELLERVFKKKNLPIYTVASAEDFSYLVDDLRPELIVLDVQTALDSKEAFLKQLEASQLLKSLPFILIDPAALDHDFIPNKIGEFQRPFDPFEIPAEISEIIKKN